MIAIACADLLESRSAESYLLFLWVLGTFVFASFFNWVINGRSILPMAPAVGILLARRIEQHTVSYSGKKHRYLLCALIPAGAIALLVTWSDYNLANISRDVAKKICNKYGNGGGTLWFQGH